MHTNMGNRMYSMQPSDKAAAQGDAEAIPSVRARTPTTWAHPSTHSHRRPARGLVREPDALRLAGQRRRQPVVLIVDAGLGDLLLAAPVAPQQRRDAARVLLRRALLVVALGIDLAPGDLGRDGVGLGSGRGCLM
jgi:hypothetical protein